LRQFDGFFALIMGQMALPVAVNALSAMINNHVCIARSVRATPPLIYRRDR
jgi:hypothetical protein